jgi:hypothetical protein
MYCAAIHVNSADVISRLSPLQAFIQADEVDLSAAVELGDEYLAKRDDVQRAQERRWVASESYEASAKAAAALDNKWRQRCLIDALASTSCSDVGSADDRKLLSERLTVTRKNRGYSVGLYCLRLAVIGPWYCSRPWFLCNNVDAGRN